MKINNKYILLSMATMVTVVGMSLGSAGFAQTVTPLACSVAPAIVSQNQGAVFTATGGNGTYSWSGPNLSINNSAGSQFTVSYPNTGTYPITVTSAGLTATCNMTVAAASTGNLTCSPAVQNVVLGQTAVVAASGGNGSYTWSSPDLSITNPTGSGFSASFASTGIKTLTVVSNGSTATCQVNVLASGNVTPPVVTPGLPNTGGGYGR